MIERMLTEPWRVHCNLDRDSLQPIETGALMIKISDRRDRNRNTEPSSPGRRTFVKSIAAMGAGVAAFPLLTNTADAQVPALPRAGSLRDRAEKGSSLRFPWPSMATRSTGTDSTVTTS